MNRWAPKGIGVLVLPGLCRRKDGRHVPSDPGFQPCSGVVLVNGAYGMISVLERNPRHGDALFPHRSAIIREKQIEVLLLAVESHGCVAMSARKEAVLRGAIDGISGFEDD